MSSSSKVLLKGCPMAFIGRTSGNVLLASGNPVINLSEGIRGYWQLYENKNLSLGIGNF
jgi:hypothetical protein